MQNVRENSKDIVGVIQNVVIMYFAFHKKQKIYFAELVLYPLYFTKSRNLVC